MKVRPSLDWLLVLVPVAIGMRLLGAPEIAIFLTSRRGDRAARRD